MLATVFVRTVTIPCDRIFGPWYRSKSTPPLVTCPTCGKVSMVRRDVYVLGILCGFAVGFPLGWLVSEVVPFSRTGRNLLAAIVAIPVAFSVAALVSRARLYLEPVAKDQ